MEPIQPLPPPGRDPRLPPDRSADLNGFKEAINDGTPPIAQIIPPQQPPAAPARRSRRPRAELTTAQRQVNAADEAGFAALETELGGRAALAAILAGADLNQDEAKIAGLLADPQNDQISLAKVCVGANLSMARLMKLFQAAALAKGQTKAIAKIAARLPDVAAGVMDDAVAGERVCPVCNGYQFLPKPTTEDPEATEKCRECLGKGTIIHVPDSDVREMALRIGGLLEKGGGAKILIANQNNGGGGSVADSASFDKLMSAIDGALYGEGRARQASGGGGGPQQAPPVDGEVVE